MHVRRTGASRHRRPTWYIGTSEDWERAAIRIGVVVNGVADARYRYAVSFGYRSRPSAEDAIPAVEEQLIEMLAQHRQMRVDAIASGESVR